MLNHKKKQAWAATVVLMALAALIVAFSPAGAKSPTMPTLDKSAEVQMKSAKTPPPSKKKQVTPVVGTGYGEIKGTIIDVTTGDPVIGASVAVVGTNRGAMTDFDGKYVVGKLQPGLYVLRITHLDYKTVEVTDIEVQADLTKEVNVALEQGTTELSEKITVCAGSDESGRGETRNQTSRPSEEVYLRGGEAGGSKKDVDRPAQQALHSPKIGIPVPVAEPKLPATGDYYAARDKSEKEIRMHDNRGLRDRLQPIPRRPRPDWDDDEVPFYRQPWMRFPDMFFEYYGTNPFTYTRDDRFSTFAADVDDASYRIVENYLKRGQLPPQDAVRVEEFINHFTYDYDAPRRETFRVFAEGAPSPLGYNKDLIRIGIKGREVSDRRRQEANLVFVIDVSGSMGRDNRLGMVRHSLIQLVNQLRPSDRVGIVVFGSHAEVILTPTSVRYRHEITSAINRLHAGGSTNAEHGLRLGYEMAERYLDNNRINRVILCSDGVANVGETNADRLVQRIRRFAARGITLSTVGFGMGNYNDVLMEKLANKGDGNYAYVNDMEAARDVFVNDLTGMLQMIAKDVKIQIEFNPDVVHGYRLLGYENRDVADRDFRNDRVDGGEIGAGHEVTAVYEVEYTHRARGDKIATVNIRYKDPQRHNEVNEISGQVRRSAVRARQHDAGNEFQLAAAAAEFAECLRGSYWSMGADLRHVEEVVERLADEMESPEVDEFLQLIRLARRHDRELANRW